MRAEKTSTERESSVLRVVRADRLSYRRRSISLLANAAGAVKSRKLLIYSVVVTGLFIGTAARLAVVSSEQAQPPQPRQPTTVTYLPKTGIRVEHYGK